MSNVGGANVPTTLSVQGETSCVAPPSNIIRCGRLAFLHWTLSRHKGSTTYFSTPAPPHSYRPATAPLSPARAPTRWSDMFCARLPRLCVLYNVLPDPIQPPLSTSLSLLHIHPLHEPTLSSNQHHHHLSTCDRRRGENKRTSIQTTWL